ncbi:MAG: arylesterase [Legionellales bacterium]|mgnify:CR=1 FL=1|nr:arylesterase [Legionellales bacterium]|tara:strand:- start:755 stop:1357 length:603 start_codon:yes stop_codon:yes gene_type:complete
MKSYWAVVLCVLSTSLAIEQILVVGDSISSGHGMILEDSWPVQLERHAQQHNWEMTVINTSVSGYTTLDGIQVLTDALQQHQPTWTVIALGGNDGLMGLPIETIYTNLVTMIDIAQSYQQQIVLVAMTLPPNWGARYIEQFEGIYHNLSLEYPSIKLVKFSIDEFINLMQEDGIHPSTAAQSMIMTRIYDAITKPQQGPE